MELYIKVQFWITLITIFIRCLAMGLLSWPHKKEITLGEYIGSVIVSLGFLIWAGIVLWVH